MPDSAGEPTTFADLLRRLMAEPNPKTGKPWSYGDVAGGTGLSKQAVGNLANGVNRNPSRETMRALARCFGVHPSYFFPEDHDEELRNLMQDLGVRRIAARAVGLSADSQNMIINVLERIRQIEQPAGNDGTIPTPPPV